MSYYEQPKFVANFVTVAARAISLQKRNIGSQMLKKNLVENTKRYDYYLTYDFNHHFNHDCNHFYLVIFFFNFLGISLGNPVFFLFLFLSVRLNLKKS